MSQTDRVLWLLLHLILGPGLLATYLCLIQHLGALLIDISLIERENGCQVFDFHVALTVCSNWQKIPPNYLPTYLPTYLPRNVNLLMMRQTSIFCNKGSFAARIPYWRGRMGQHQGHRHHVTPNLSVSLNNCEIFPDWAIYCTLGNFSKPVTSIICPNRPHFQGSL